MDANTYKDTNKETPERRTKLTLQRGNFYYAMGFVLVAGLIAVVGLGVAGIPSLGIFTVSTAMAMAAIAITLLALVSFVTLTTMRRTLGLLSHHETAIGHQASLVAALQKQYQADQLARDNKQSEDILGRDNKQSEDIASLAAIQDASFINQQTEAERRRVRIVPRGARPSIDPFDGGQVHPVREVEGIGDHYGGLLDSLGIKDTKRLWNADPSYVAGALKVRPGLVENWQCMAELMAVRGIGKQYAEVLVRVGVQSIRGLCRETPQGLLDQIIRLERRQGTRLQGNTIGIKTVQTWIEAAQSHSPAARAQAVGRSTVAGG